MPRRRALLGLLAAPALIKTPGLLMPVKPLPAATPCGFIYGRVSVDQDGIWSEYFPVRPLEFITFEVTVTRDGSLFFV